jgi:hypothetical protein
VAKPKESDAVADPLERIARLLAMIATKDFEKEDAATRLLAAGFDAKQIAGILDVNPNFAHTAKNRKKKAKR